MEKMAFQTVESLLKEIRQLINDARSSAIRQVNKLQLDMNFAIGRLIVEYEQNGDERAAYGKKLVEQLAINLNSEYGRGFSVRNLAYMRKYYLLNRAKCKEILQTVSAKSENTLSWSHYVFLMGIKDDAVRNFYEIEAKDNNGSLSELNRQFNSALFERLALSRDKQGIKELSEKGQLLTKAQDALKNPYVLEFLGLEEKNSYSESELETAIIDKIEHFLLELGKGFLFESRQKRFTFDEDHFFVDLVFYNRLLRCYVLIDLKIGKLMHQDLGQMQMYVNYFDRFVKTETENSTVGIVMCRKNREALVEITLPKGANIHASEYLLYLPDKKELKQKLLDWAAEAIEGKSDENNQI